VIGFVTAATVPNGLVAANVPKPMPPAVANHVAAVALFGKPSIQFMNAIGQPPIVIGPLYAAKTTDLCAPNDPICSGAGDIAAHGMYVDDGLVNQAAGFAASRL
jgi:cutinase